MLSTKNSKPKIFKTRIRNFKPILMEVTRQQAKQKLLSELRTPLDKNEQSRLDKIYTKSVDRDLTSAE